MNQRIAVRALIKKDEKVLLLRRASGRQSIYGKYELPGGRIEYDEQPEDALSRHISEQTRLVPQTIQLSDVLTYIDHDNRDIQYAIVFYLVSIGSVELSVSLGVGYDHYVWRKSSSIQQEHVTDLTHMLLNIHDKAPSLFVTSKISDSDNNTSLDKLTIYSDGGSRGNPGPSAAAFVVIDAEGNLLAEGGAYLGITTNNQAEYHGVHLGLEKARELGVKAADFRLDSLLVVNQLNGAYVIRNRELWPIHERIRALVSQFDKVTFRHVKREFNQRADSLVNKILDDQASKNV
jgi:ribonuclease HI/ADP-ribose pyrophosphatase YjhB (NUDIX family)